MPTNHAIFVDAGTTNTRVWLLHNEAILARAHAMVGVRDSARDGNNTRLRTTLRDLIATVRAEVAIKPDCVIAAGMITSALGLAEIPHLPAPAGAAELAAAMQVHHFSDVTDLPVYLVPGVRSGAAQCDYNSVAAVDIMRGEETLCIGLLTAGQANSPGTIFNLGSHWKAIQLDEQKRIAKSITTLTGELIHSTQTNTILASAVPPQRPPELPFDWVQAGMREQHQAGLPRALFCVRLLEQKGENSPAQRMAFLVGAYVAADFDGLCQQGIFAPQQPVAITGGGTIAAVWQQVFAHANIPAEIITAENVEAGLLTGLQTILQLAGQR